MPDDDKKKVKSIWPKAGYDPRKDKGPVRPEDKPKK